MLINTVLHNEADRNAHMLNEYRNLLAQLPKGSLICRKDYYYLKYRENGKVCRNRRGADIRVRRLRGFARVRILSGRAALGAIFAFRGREGLPRISGGRSGRRRPVRRRRGREAARQIL